MRFCPQCESIMSKNTIDSNDIKFVCHCGVEEKSDPSDTLMEEEYLNVAESAQKHEVFVQNSPHDPAGKRVKRTCGKCGLDYMTLIIIGIHESAFYTCKCGNLEQQK